MTNSTAKALLTARLAGQLIECEPLPSTEKQAYVIQQAIIDANDDTISGIKIGATNAKTQAILGLSQPFFGPVFTRGVFSCRNGEQLAQAPLKAANPVKIETEFVIGLKSTLIGKQDGITLDEVTDAIDWIAPGFELIGSRIQNIPEKAGLCAIADGGGNHNVILGKPDHNWKKRNWQTHRAVLNINGKQVAEGHSGDSDAGSPIGMLHWLLNFEGFTGKQIVAGQFVFCGTCTDPVIVNAGDQLHADFGELGELRATCTC